MRKALAWIALVWWLGAAVKFAHAEAGQPATWKAGV